MKKIMLLLMMAFVWWHKAASQPNAGLEQYYYMDSKNIAVSPKAWYQSGKGWYAEGRYNFEAAKTVSILAGKTFEREGVFSLAVTPLAGIVAGEFNGGVLAENASVGYKDFSFSLQAQYTFSIEDRCQNFIYGWADISLQVFDQLAAGLSVQQTKMYNQKGQSALGFFLKPGLGKWEFPLYVFNVKSNQRQIIFGLNFTYR